MYNRAKVRQNNLKQLQNATEFLQKNNHPLPSIPDPNHIAEEEDAEDESSVWDDFANLVKIAQQNKNRGTVATPVAVSSENDDGFTNRRAKVQEVKEEASRKERSASGDVVDRLQQFMYQNNFKTSHRWTPASETVTEIKSQNQEQLTDSEIIQNYSTVINTKSMMPIQKKQKQKKNNKKTNKIPNEEEVLNVIKEKNQHLFTINKLQIQKPVTKNYRVADKSEWENNRGIEDYKLQFVLRKFPKIRDFRNNQKAIIKCSLLGNDVFVCMPTGGGKSLTFQVMTFIQKGIYLCILPLVSLIIDQEQQSSKLGIKAYSLTGSKQIQQNKEVYQQISGYQPGADSIVIFCTPEKVNKSPQFMRVLLEAYENKALVKIIIDEVHCVSTWGKQFRQEYQNLSTLRENFPKTPILGLTATVTQVIKQDIIKRLNIRNCYYFQSSFNRANLIYEVKQKNKDILQSIIKVLSEHSNQSGIIYCLSRKQCEQMCQQLRNKRYRVAFYHANIDESQKRDIQSKWMRNEIQIIIATIAFGMGINKPDVRFVIHHSLSKSLENYYQESGRAGRDGQQAKCILFYRKSDKISLQSLISKNDISKDENKSFCMKQLSHMIRYCQQRYTCRRKLQLDYLGETDFNPQQCNKTCDNCMKGLQFVQAECISEAKTLVEFLMRAEQARQNISQNQIIMLCKGCNDKKFKYKMQQIERELDLSALRQTFSRWQKIHIDELITQLLSFQILYERIVTTNVYRSKNAVSNFYIKVNYSMANRFLQKVQTLPMKRNVNIKKEGHNKTSSVQLYDYDFENMDEDIRESREQQSYNSADLEEDIYTYNIYRKDSESRQPQ